MYMTYISFDIYYISVRMAISCDCLVLAEYMIWHIYYIHIRSAMSQSCLGRIYDMTLTDTRFLVDEGVGEHHVAGSGFVSVPRQIHISCDAFWWTSGMVWGAARKALAFESNNRVLASDFGRGRMYRRQNGSKGPSCSLNFRRKRQETRQLHRLQTVGAIYLFISLVYGVGFFQALGTYVDKSYA